MVYIQYIVPAHALFRWSSFVCDNNSLLSSWWSSCDSQGYIIYTGHFYFPFVSFNLHLVHRLPATEHALFYLLSCVCDNVFHFCRRNYAAVNSQELGKLISCRCFKYSARLTVLIYFLFPSFSPCMTMFFFAIILQLWIIELCGAQQFLLSSFTFCI